jgi:hypothetical protein
MSPCLLGISGRSQPAHLASIPILTCPPLHNLGDHAVGWGSGSQLTQVGR